MYQYSGRWGTIKVASKTTTDYNIGGAQYDDGTNIVPATTTSTNFAGICVTDKTASVATTADIYLKVPKDRNATFVATVTGTFTKADEGQYMDLYDENTISADAHTYKPVRCVKYINSTTGVFSVNDPIS